MDSKIDPKVFGKFQLTSSKNFDEFMRALGVSYVARTIGNKSKPLFTVSALDDKIISFKQEYLFTPSELSFQLGVPFDETTPDGRKVKSVMTHVGPNSIKHTMTGTEGGKDSVVVRTFFADEMHCVCKVDDIESTRIYKRLK